MFKKRFKLITLPLLLSLTACSLGSDDDPMYEDKTPDDESLTQAEQDNVDLFEYLQQAYFWNDELPSEINPSAYSSMPEAMYGLRNTDDRFSFVMTNEEYKDYVASVFFGYGFSHLANDTNDGLVIRYVFDQGSAYLNGLRRGDTITRANGIDIADVIAGTRTLSEAFGPNTDGYTIDVTFEKPDGTVVETQFSKSEIVANTVMASEVKNKPVTDLNNNVSQKNVGYLVFDSFKESSAAELNTAFSQFSQTGVDELILDLRYNGGGRISVAQQLSTQIAGDNVRDNNMSNIFVQYVHNDNWSQYNEAVSFSTASYELDLDRLIVLTSGNSCSASELVINALMPFIDVVTIGDETCGKPIGMYPQEINDWTVFAINFQTQNAVGFGDYFDGLPADCAVTETIVGDWGDEADPLLAEALYYLENGQCSTAAQAFSKRLKYAPSPKVDFSQGPVKMRNAL
ncbi:MAG: carboxyl-terminal protease [Gammaproteobacteria bacterium]|nr:carboxyl-terminal protease [Gammaproteobacteria bacterium]